MNAVVETSDHPLVVIREQMDRREAEFAAALPAHIPVERFKRVLLTAVQNNPDLVDADRPSLWNAAMRSAQDGLLPDGRDGAIVIYNTKDKRNGREVWIKKAQWMPMVFGVLKKIRNSGEVALITARVVYGGDRFRYWIDEEGEHVFYEPADEPDTNTVRRVFAMAKTKDGELYVEPLTPKGIEKIRSVSKSKDRGPWVEWWEEMAKESAIRRLAKRLPMSTGLDDLMRRDDALYDLESTREETKQETKQPKLAAMLDQIAGQLMAEKPAAAAVEDGQALAGEEPGDRLDDEIPDFDAMVERFEEAAPKARSLDELEEAATEVLPLIESDRLGKKLRTRAENAWADAQKRIAQGAGETGPFAATEDGENPPDDDADQPEADPSSPDYQRGFDDAQRGVKKCLSAKIRDDEQRFANWKAGYDAAAVEGEA